jgi:hypothetical protein
VVVTQEANVIGSPTRARTSVRFGVVLPVHNEEELLPGALSALDRALSHVSELSVAFGITIVLDACSDRSHDLASAWQQDPDGPWSGAIDIIEVNVGNVGQARQIGFEALLSRWSDVDPGDIWLATSDADSEVPWNWISSQLAMRSEGGQVWAGAVTVADWSGRREGTAELWGASYEAECNPIHGANFGIDAALYREAGGFARLQTGEDRDLFERTLALGAVIGHDPRVKVVTSSRRVARAPRGFAHALSSFESVVASAEAARFAPVVGIPSAVHREGA